MAMGIAALNAILRGRVSCARRSNCLQAVVLFVGASLLANRLRDGAHSRASSLLQAGSDPGETHAAMAMGFASLNTILREASCVGRITSQALSAVGSRAVVIGA